MKNRTIKTITITLFIIFALAFIAAFAGPAILKMYIETGIGNCQKIPILCMKPTEKINTTALGKEYLNDLVVRDFPKVSIAAPRGFDVVNELIKKSDNKKWKRKNIGSIIYLIYQEPNFFIKLYPQVKKLNIKDNYDFIQRMMTASPNEIKNLNDAFFVIMKSILIPDLGDQTKAKMEKFVVGDKRGFINYNITGTERFFDCKTFDSEGNLFGIYIKDKGATLDLDKVLAIVSTAKGR
jgi:hypothetical protein